LTSAQRLAGDLDPRADAEWGASRYDICHHEGPFHRQAPGSATTHALPRHLQPVRRPHPSRRRRTWTPAALLFAQVQTSRLSD